MHEMKSIVSKAYSKWDNEKYKTNKHIQVQEIKRDSEQSIVFYRNKIRKQLEKKRFLNSSANVKGRLTKIDKDFKEYQMSLYLYSFSSFIEVMLLENFDKKYLDSVASKIDDYDFKYRELYTDSYSKIEKELKTSVETYLLDGFGNANKLLGNAIAKVPVISKSQIDENLNKAGDFIKKYNSKSAEKTMLKLKDKSNSYIRPFIANIDIVNQIYNEPMNILIDSDNIYFNRIEG